jgi:hypothetical protein
MKEDMLKPRGFFNQSDNSVLVKDYKNRNEKTFVTPKNTQDILSAFYYLRNYPNIDKISPGSLLPSICL